MLARMLGLVHVDRSEETQGNCATANAADANLISFAGASSREWDGNLEGCDDLTRSKSGTRCDSKGSPQPPASPTPSLTLPADELETEAVAVAVAVGITQDKEGGGYGHEEGRGTDYLKESADTAAPSLLLAKTRSKSRFREEDSATPPLKGKASDREGGDIGDDGSGSSGESSAPISLSTKRKRTKKVVQRVPGKKRNLPLQRRGERGGRTEGADNSGVGGNLGGTSHRGNGRPKRRATATPLQPRASRSGRVTKRETCSLGSPRGNNKAGSDENSPAVEKKQMKTGFQDEGEIAAEREKGVRKKREIEAAKRIEGKEPTNLCDDEGKVDAIDLDRHKSQLIIPMGEKKVQSGPTCKDITSVSTNIAWGATTRKAVGKSRNLFTIASECLRKLSFKVPDVTEMTVQEILNECHRLVYGSVTGNIPPIDEKAGLLERAHMLAETLSVATVETEEFFLNFCPSAQPTAPAMSDTPASGGMHVMPYLTLPFLGAQQPIWPPDFPFVAGAQQPLLPKLTEGLIEPDTSSNQPNNFTINSLKSTTKKNDEGENQGSAAVSDSSDRRARGRPKKPPPTRADVIEFELAKVSYIKDYVTLSYYLFSMRVLIYKKSAPPL